MFYNSIKHVNRFRKQINRFLIKKLSKFFSKVTIEKNWRSQNFDFLNLKNLSTVQFLGSSNSCWLLNFKNSCCNLKIRGLGAKRCVAFQLFSFWKELWSFKVRVHVFCSTKKQTLIKSKRNQKLKISHTALQKRTLCFSSYKNHKLKMNCDELVKEIRGHFL